METIRVIKKDYDFTYFLLCFPHSLPMCLIVKSFPLNTTFLSAWVPGH